jgi:5-methylcytosine-specific restriction endonuclease McrBC regulatory subunit McrC
MLPLEVLWERYVEHVVRDEARVSGGPVRAGRLGETVIPLPWTATSHRSLGHLLPDFIVRRRGTIEIVDAKYKSHFADLDLMRWSALTEETQSSMRADIHQILAYAAAAGSSDEIVATLIYPVQRELYEDLQSRGRTQSEAKISVGTRQLTLRVRGIAFGVA